jgi:YbbR domain-containing protein
MREAFLKDVLRRWVLNEIRLKTLAVVLAVLLWFSMTYMSEQKITYSVPIAFESLSKTMVVREADTRDVLITLNGPLSILKNLRSKDIKVTLDLSRARDGRQIFSIRKGDVLVPSGVKIENLQPDYVVVEIDKIMEKQLRTVVKLSDKWVGIYRVLSWQPHYVSAEGPGELLEKKEPVETVPVDGDFTKQQEVLSVPLNVKPFLPAKVKPEAVRVILKRIER